MLRLPLVVLVVMLAASGRAQAPDPLLAAGSTDPLELARVVDAIGDDAVIERLSDGSALPVRLLAVRATPWLHAPERALPALVPIAAGRDPDLAIAAAQATVRIAEALDRAELDAREDEGEEIRGAIEPLGALAADATARADVRWAASVAGASLRALVFPPEPAE